MIVKKIFSFLILVFLLGTITGCQKKNTAETAVDAENAGKSVVMQIWTAEEPQFFTSIAREFVAEVGLPNLRFKVVFFEDESQLKTFLINQLAEGRGPDIVYTDGEWITHNTGKLLPAKNEDDGFNTENFKNTFVEIVNEFFVKSNNIYGIPMGVDTLGLFFNDEHIKDRLPNSNYPGRTWEQFKADVVALTKTDNSFERFYVSGAALGRFDNVTYGPDILENIMLQMGVQFFDESETQALFHKTETQESGKPKVNLGVESVNFFSSFADNRFKNFSWNDLMAGSGGKNKDFEAFVKGKTSMVFGYVRDIKKINEIIESLKSSNELVISEKNIRTATIPQVDDPALGLNQRVTGKVYGLAVSRTTKYPDTAWKFLKFVSQRENLQSWHKETLYPSPRVDLLSEQLETPMVDVFVRQAKIARANIFPINKVEFNTGFLPFMLAINEGKVAIDKSLKTFADQLSAGLRSQKSKEKEIDSDEKISTAMNNE